MEAELDALETSPKLTAKMKLSKEWHGGDTVDPIFHKHLVGESISGEDKRDEIEESEEREKKWGVTWAEHLRQECHPKKLIPYRGKFVKVERNQDMPGKIVKLCNKMEGLSQAFDHTTLLAALEAAIPEEALLGINEDGQMTLTQVINILRNRYNSPQLLEQAEQRLRAFKGEVGQTITGNILQFFSMVNSFNLRCAKAGIRFQRKAWNRARVFYHACDYLINNEMYKVELYRLWSTKAKTSDVENWRDEDIRQMLTSVEAITAIGNKACNKIAVSGTGQVCYRCGKFRQLHQGRWGCPCGIGTVCGVTGCGRNHKTEYHDEALKWVAKFQTRNRLPKKKTYLST